MNFAFRIFFFVIILLSTIACTGQESSANNVAPSLATSTADINEDMSSVEELDDTQGEIIEEEPLKEEEIEENIVVVDSADTSASPEALQTVAAIQESSSTNFTSLLQDYSLTADLETPTMYISTSPEDTNQYKTWLEYPDIDGVLAEVNFESQTVIAIFRGVTGSNGYGVQTENVSVENGTLYIVVSLSEPASGQASSSVQAYPYEIITIQNDLLGNDFNNWQLYSTEGFLLAESA